MESPYRLATPVPPNMLTPLPVSSELGKHRRFPKRVEHQGKKEEVTCASPFTKCDSALVQKGRKLLMHSLNLQWLSSRARVKWSSPVPKIGRRDCMDWLMAISSN